MHSKVVSMADMYPVIKEVIENGGEVSIIATGDSMMPMLTDGRDSIVLTQRTGKLKKYDLPFYRRKNGVFVVHRVVKIVNGEYILCGDNQFSLEKDITDKEVIAMVKSFTRNNKTYTVESKKYKLYCIFWVNSRWFRQKYTGLKRRIKKLIYRK